jgi:hypothetical protein
MNGQIYSRDVYSFDGISEVLCYLMQSTAAMRSLSAQGLQDNHLMRRRKAAKNDVQKFLMADVIRQCDDDML